MLMGNNLRMSHVIGDVKSNVWRAELHGQVIIHKMKHRFTTGKGANSETFLK